MTEAATTADVVPTPRRTHVAHAWLREHPHTLLVEEAERRRMHPDALVAKIIETAMLEDWTATLLDP